MQHEREKRGIALRGDEWQILGMPEDTPRMVPENRLEFIDGLWRNAMEQMSTRAEINNRDINSLPENPGNPDTALQVLHVMDERNRIVEESGWLLAAGEGLRAICASVNHPDESEVGQLNALYYESPDE
jgi:hypothetical protein